MRSCAQRRKFPSVGGQLQKKARSPLYNVESILRSDPLWVCRVSAMMITVSFTSMSCNKKASSEHTPEGLSVSSSENGTYKEKTFGPFSASSFFSLVTESSKKAVVRSLQDRICLRNVPLPSYSILSSWSHQKHDRSAVRDSVSQ